MRYHCEVGPPHWPYPLEIYIRDVNFFRYNWHTGYELLLFLRGRADLYTGGVRHTLCGGDVFLINTNCGHVLISAEKESTALVVHFPCEYFSLFASPFHEPTIECASTSRTRSQNRFVRLREYASRTLLALLSGGSSGVLLAHGAFYMLLGTLLAEFPMKNGEQREFPHGLKAQKTIRRVTDWLEKNYNSKVSLETAADTVRYSRTYFSTFFKRNVGITFYDYLTRVRFRHALYQMNYTSKSLTMIAADCGFPDLKTFSSYYKRSLHESPSVGRSRKEQREFTLAAENERVFINTDHAEIAEILRSFMCSAPPCPSEKARENDDDVSDLLACIGELGRRIAKLADGEDD